MDQETNTQNRNVTEETSSVPINQSQGEMSNPVPVTDYLNTNLKDLANNKFEKTDVTDYHSVPFYRRTWFVFIVWLIFIPGTVAIVLTGDVYRLNRKDNTVSKWTGKEKTGLLLLSFFLIVLGVFNLYF